MFGPVPSLFPLLMIGPSCPDRPHALHLAAGRGRPAWCAHVHTSLSKWIRKQGLKDAYTSKLFGLKNIGVSTLKSYAATKDKVGLIDQENYGLTHDATRGHPLSCFTAILASAVDVYVTFPAPGCSFTPLALLLKSRNLTFGDRCQSQANHQCQPLPTNDAWTYVYICMGIIIPCNNVCVYTKQDNMKGSVYLGPGTGHQVLGTWNLEEERNFKGSGAKGARALFGQGQRHGLEEP